MLSEQSIKMDAQTNEGTRKEERPYQKQAEGMTDYLLREIRDHASSGVYSDALKTLCSRYIEVQLTFAHEGKVASEEDARRLAHEMTSKDLSHEVY